MSTQYGVRYPSGAERWYDSRRAAELDCRYAPTHTLIAREVGPSRVVSIRS